MPYHLVIDVLNEDKILFVLVLRNKAVLFFKTICISYFFLAVYQIKKTQLDIFFILLRCTPGQCYFA